MFSHSFRAGRIAGVEIKIDASWVIIALLIGYSFYARLRVLHDELAVGATAALAFASATVFFGSVLLHELAHAVMARLRGIPVKGITLFLFGGATEAQVESKEPKDEFLITIVGPLTSLALGAVLGVASLLGSPQGPVGGTIGYLAWINVALAVFNLLPGLPLDGGRLLRSVTWASTGDLNRATTIAARAGQILGYGVVALGVVALLGGGIGGLWFIFIGWFLAQAAQASRLELQVRHLLRGVRAGDVMSGRLIAIPGDITIEDAVQGFFLRYDHSAFPVELDGETVGLLTMRAVRRLPPEERRDRRVDDCMRPLEGLSAVTVDTPLDDVIRRFEEEDLHRVLVRENGHVAGIVTPHDVSRWLRRSQELTPAKLTAIEEDEPS